MEKSGNSGNICYNNVYLLMILGTKEDENVSAWKKNSVASGNKCILEQKFGNTADIIDVFIKWRTVTYMTRLYSIERDVWMT